jgi:hypothetical protein
MKCKGKSFLILAIGISQFLTLTGCSSVPVKPESDGTLFDKSIDEVQKASVNALIEFGFDVTKSEPFYVEGYRPRKWGFFSSSGGETCGIWLESLGPSKTNVRVSTARTSFGIIGQRIWDDDILKDMQSELGKGE